MLWGVAGVVVHLPMTGVMFGIAAVVSEPVLMGQCYGSSNLVL